MSVLLMYCDGVIKAEFNLTLGTFTITTSESSLLTVAKMGRREVKLLTFFLENSERIVTKQEILDAVWPSGLICKNNAVVSLSKLRKLIKKVDPDCKCLMTVSGQGYVFSSKLSGFKRTNTS